MQLSDRKPWARMSIPTVPLLAEWPWASDFTLLRLRLPCKNKKGKRENTLDGG